jgi:hypothetical protein
MKADLLRAISHSLAAKPEQRSHPSVERDVAVASAGHQLTLPPNPSVKGTSCGKPQAAPYLER